MAKKIVNTNLVVALLVVTAVLGYGLIGKAGNLEPSAAPAPTMKTLDEVEPRIPIQSLSGNANFEYIISSSGSYYLTGNVTTTKIAISVTADNVTIDLMGFSLVGPDSGTNYGIYMISRSNVEIRNGTVRDFYMGIYEGNNLGNGHRVIDVRVISNTLRGINLIGKGHVVKGCTVSDNGTSAASNVYGIYTGLGRTVTGNTVNENGTSASGYVYGIGAESSSTVTGNMVYNNGDSATGSYIYGIYVGLGSTVTGNTVNENGTSASGDVYGIRTDSASTVTGNTAYHNGASATGSKVYGIYTGSGSTVTDNTARDNGDSATGSSVFGIWLGGYNLVDQNTAYSNGTSAFSATQITYGIGGCVFGINVPPAP